MNVSKPLSKQELEKRIADAVNSLPDTVTNRLVDDINRGINEAVIRNSTSYFTSVPSVILGFPAYSARDVISRIARLYKESGFRVKECNTGIDISWGAYDS